MKKTKYTATFSAEIFAAKEIPEFTKNTKESLASLEELAPASWEAANIDLLAVAFDGAVINMFNANDDGIASSVAVRMMDKFRHKPINIEHDRSRIIGHITNVAFTDRTSHDFLWEEEALKTKSAYNLSLGGFIYKMVNQDFFEELEASMDSDSPSYHSISASWEVGFNSFAIALGSSEMQYAEIIENPIEVAKYAPYLKAFGGTGVTEDGRRVYRLITGEVYPLGMGFVKNPAADVKGIYSQNKTDAECKKRKIAAKKEDFIANKEPDISQSEKNNVKTHDLKISMDLLEQLKEALAGQEKVTQEVAANITKQFADAIKEANEDYCQKLEAKEKAIEDAKAKQEELESSVAEIKEKLTEAETKIKDFEAREAEEALASARDQRLEQIDSLYELDDDDRKVIVADLKNFDVTSDEEFEAYANKLATLLRHKNKEALAKKAEEEKEAKAIAEAKASAEKGKEGAAAEDDAEALAKAKANEDGALPNNNGGDGEPQSMAEKFKNAFSKDNVKVSY